MVMFDPTNFNNVMQLPQSQNVPVAPVDQMQSIPPDIQHVTDVLSQYVNSKQNQSAGNGGMLENILSQRFQPDTGDVGRSILQTAQSYGSPELFKPITPNQAAQERVSSELAPYTTALDLQSKQADIMAKRAQAGIFGNSMMSGGTAGQPQITGDTFLKTLDPNQAAQVKALAEGRMQFPAGFALKSPYWQQMISAVSQYDPNFDAVNYGSRAKTRASFASGADANNIAALNTAMAHLGTLSKDYQGLDNGSLPWWNSIANATGNALGNSNIQTNTANVGAASEAVAHELAKVFRSTGMSEGEINAWKEKISTSASPAQSQAVINSALDLMDGRLSALGEKYNQGMGTTKQPLELLSPEAQQAYNKLRGFKTNAPVNNQASPSNADPLGIR